MKEAGDIFSNPNIIPIALLAIAVVGAVVNSIRQSLIRNRFNHVHGKRYSTTP